MTNPNEVLMPVDFPNREFNEITERVAKFGNDPRYKEFAGGHHGVKYRLRACYDHSDQFVSLFDQFGVGPARIEDRVGQESNLFGFFSSGLSALECFGYCIHFMASLINSTDFQTTNLKAITLKSTSTAFAVAYPTEGITTAIQVTLNSDEFSKWSDLRNILSHRSAPVRNFFMSGPENTNWQAGSGNIKFDRDLTTDRLSWLKSEMNALVVAANKFALAKF